MDFQTLGRRDLQALCKRNRIPANITNAAMADALRALSNVEGIAEIQEAMQYQSPKKSEATSPKLPRTGRRTSVRRAPPSREEPRERQASPLPRARRVTADASEIMMMVAEGEGPEEKHDAVLKVPLTPVSCAGQKTRVPSTRRRVSNKEVEGVEVKEEAGIPPTPVSSLRPRRLAAKVPDTPPAAAMATRSVRKTAVPRVVETPKVDVKEEKASVQRRTRQPSSKKIEETAAVTTAIATTARRSTRIKAVPKMACLGPEAEEQEAPAPLNPGRKSTRSNAAVKIKSLVQETKEQEGKDVAGISDLCPSGPIQEPLDSDDVVQKPVIGGVVDQEDSPIKGLVEQSLEEKTPSAKSTDEGGALIGELQPSTEEIDNVQLDFHPQEIPFGDESPEEMVASVDHQLPTDEPKTDDVPVEADIPIDVPVCGDSVVGLTPNVVTEAEIEGPFNDNLTSPAVSPVKESSEVETILTGEVAVESDSFEQEIVAPTTETEATLVETKAGDESESTILSADFSSVKESSVLELLITDEIVQELETTNAPIDDSLATEAAVASEVEPILTGEVAVESDSFEQEIIAPAAETEATLVETKAANDSESTILSAYSSPVKESSVLELIITDEIVQELETNAPIDYSLATETEVASEVEPILTGEVAVESDSYEQEIVAPATETEATLVETKAADESESTILSADSSPVKESSVLELIITDEIVQELETNAPIDDSLATETEVASEVETILTGEVAVESDSFEHEIFAPTTETEALVETKAANEFESTILSADSSPVKESSVLELTITDEILQKLETNSPINSLATKTVVETKASGESDSIILNVISSPLVLMPDVCLDSTSSPTKESIELELKGSDLGDALSESSPFQLACSPGPNGGSLATLKDPSVGVDSEQSNGHVKENKDAADGEANKSMAKKKHPVHYSQISLRKLKSIYKEKLISKKDDHKVELEVKRTALTALDENSL